VKLVVASIAAATLAAALASTAPSDPIVAAKIELPTIVEWTRITDESAGGQRIREWVPVGASAEKTDWIIVEQKLAIDASVSARTFIETSFRAARSACTDVLYNGPDRVDGDGHETWVGRIMCAQQIGKTYGTFTDQRVAVGGQHAFVVTSELRIPSSPKAGVLSFGSDQPDGVERFLARTEASADFVRKSVRFCTASTRDC